MEAHLHGLSAGEFCHPPGQNVWWACGVALLLPRCLAEHFLSNVRVCCRLPLTPFACGRDFSLLPFVFSLLSEVVKLGFCLVAVFLLGVELLL